MTRPNISLHVSGIENAFYKIRCDSLEKDCHYVLSKKVAQVTVLANTLYVTVKVWKTKIILREGIFIITESMLVGLFIICPIFKRDNQKSLWTFG